MNMEQWTALQPRILDAQRLALVFGELGEMKVARKLLEAATMASRLKPAVQPAPEAAKKGKGA